MTDHENNVVPFKKPTSGEDDEELPLFGPFYVDDWMSAILDQIRVANPDCFDPDAIDYKALERIIRAIAYYGIYGEEPRRKP